MLPDRFLPLAAERPAGKRRSKRLRNFLAALGRYRPVLAVSLDSLDSGAEAGDSLLHVLVVTDGSLDWATVDRLSDGGLQPVVYDEAEFLAAMSDPLSPLAEAVHSGTVLYDRDESAARLVPLLMAPHPLAGK